MNAQGERLECTKCGEVNDPGRQRCWFCRAPLDVAITVDVEAPEANPRMGISIIATVLMAFALSVVCFGVLLLAPGLGVILALVMSIPLIRTTLVLSRRKQRGETTTFATTSLLFVGSAFVTWIILTVVGVAAFGTFCFTCMATYNSSRGGGDQTMLPSLIASLLVVVVLCFFFWKWVRARWRRDMGSGSADRHKP